MAAYRRMDGLKSPAGWLPVQWDQLRAQRSETSMGELYLFSELVVTISKHTRHKKHKPLPGHCQNMCLHGRHQRTRPTELWERDSGFQRDLYVHESQQREWSLMGWDLDHAALKNVHMHWTILWRNYWKYQYHIPAKYYRLSIWKWTCHNWESATKMFELEGMFINTSSLLIITISNLWCRT